MLVPVHVKMSSSLTTNLCLILPGKKPQLWELRRLLLQPSRQVFRDLRIHPRGPRVDGALDPGDTQKQDSPQPGGHSVVYVSPRDGEKAD